MSRLEFETRYIPRGPNSTKYRRDDSASNTTRKPVLAANPDIRKYVQKMQNRGTEGWLASSEIPTSQEIMCVQGDIDLEENCINLEPNRVDGPWSSKEEYLRTHYELLREDAVALLRDSVAYLRNKPSMTDTRNICIYDQVYITGMTFAKQGLAVKVSFSTARACKNIVWEYSSRLISGAMVALSPAKDCFKSQCVIAIVAARPLEQVKQHPPLVDLYFANPDEASFDPQQEWIMVEPRTGYLEAVRHTMSTLQLMNDECFPLRDHICSLEKDIDVPEYVISDPNMRISPGQVVDVSSDWPREPANNLDTSQWEALHHILTKRLAIIQGPPGTGKTHVSVTALKMLLANRKPGDPPIIVAAHTNHALDQLLNHMAEVVPDYVRLGGRSMDENVRKRTLYEVRKSNQLPALFGGSKGPARRKLQSISENIVDLLQAFTKDLQGALPATFFRDHKIISEKQYESLCNGAKGWKNSSLEEQADPIVQWVGDMLVENSVTYKYEDRGYEDDEMDLEYEQLREMEQEKGILDDDFETLRGPFMPLKEGSRGKSNVNDELAELPTIENFWEIPLQNRGTVYNVLCRLAKEKLLSAFRGHLKQYVNSATDWRIGKWEEDYAILKDTKLVGMTTTGLSKYRALVSALKPKIIMIEEAAEVIEAPVTAACVESLEHLILVGDHKQLQGSCSVTDLEGEPFFLNMSMFERLVQNGVDYRALRHQRRMAPEIRRLLTPIYKNLEDHPSVNSLDKVPGMGDVRSFLFCHQWMESSDSLASRYNAQEAEMVVTFFLHLFFSGVDPDVITVLTFYNGQRKKILKMLKETRHLQGRHLKVNTVDSYQGEENDIVLLSLVRSNEQGNIGFLSIENRVCVALSRARRGFYIFGNAENLASTDPLWWEVAKIMGEGDKESRRLGFHLPLTCDKHSNKEFVSKPEDIKELNGGCRLPCETVLDCGHRCPVKCHGFDHSLIQCKERCNKVLPCGHNCRDVCSAPCSCQCGYKTSRPSSPEKPINKSTQSSPSKTNNLSPRREQRHQTTVKNDVERVQAFQKYAQGGSREHDRMLDQKLSAEAKESILARLDEAEAANLFTEPPQQVQDLDVRVLSPVNDEGNGARTRWVQSFTPAMPKLEPSAIEEDLIDFD